MPSVTLPVFPAAPLISVTSVIDVLLVAIIIYQLAMLIRGRRAAPVLFGVLILGIVYLLSAYFRLELLRTVLARLAPYTPVALIVIFQSELRRLLSRLGRGNIPWMNSRLERRDTLRDVVLAVRALASNSTGALIVIERDIGLRTFMESGLKLDACVSSDLLGCIFAPGNPLHDGAVIIHRDRIAAAACFLPLTMNPHLSRSLGTRHRAAIGITEEADCISVIVSEETGRISIAAFGELEFDVDLERLEQRLTDHARRREPPRWTGDSTTAGRAVQDVPVETVREAKRG